MAGAMGLALLAGCAIDPKPVTPEEMAKQGASDRLAMFKGMEPLAKPLAIDEAIERALRHNLEKRARMMEEALALGQLDLDAFEMLPKLTANAGYSGRSKENASTSIDLVTRKPSDANPTYSADRDHKTFDLGLTWNMLDFGVSYFAAHQNADRALIAREKRRKAVANLVQDVRFAFWRAAAAQKLKSEVADTIKLAEQALIDARRVEAEKLRDPTESLRFQKTLLENLRQLEALEQELVAARNELAALVNVAPGTEILLEIPADLVVPAWPMAPERMEETAFANNPDLREQAYHGRIAIDETRKTMLKLLPGISFNLTHQYDDNSLMVYNRWQEYGAKVTWNLMTILSAPYQIDHAETAEKVAEAKRLALRMAVLTQVHVGLHQFGSAAKQFNRADDLWKVETRLSKTSAKRQEGDAQSVIERVGTQTAAVAAELRRYQTYAQLQQAYGKLEATIGKDWAEPAAKAAEATPEPVATAPAPEPAPAPVAATGIAPSPEGRPFKVVVIERPSIDSSYVPPPVRVIGAEPAPLVTAPEPPTAPVRQATSAANENDPAGGWFDWFKSRLTPPTRNETRR